jgi:hypothetical protein
LEIPLLFCDVGGLLVGGRAAAPEVEGCSWTPKKLSETTGGLWA